MHSFFILFWLLPSTAQAVFTTPGNFEVNPDGSAGYTIPIQVPPGTGGMAPKLSLVYNSNGGNGVLGMGWSLEGLSQVGRCPKTMAQDGVRGGINLDSNDRYCLDGQRLISTGGTYGADGTEYRTELASFAKIISYGTAGNGPAWFKVWTKAGQVMEYGNTADARIEAQGKPTVLSWAVNKVSDTKGNYFTVSYTEDNANGETLVNRIDYTGNATTTPALAPYASVQFTYETRPDTGIAYLAGSVSKSTKRMINVKTYTGTILVKDYRFAYELGIATNSSRIKTFTECDGASVAACQVPAKINWSDTANGYTSIYISRGGLNRDHTSVIGGDYNGNGKSDFIRQDGTQWGGGAWVFLSNGDGTFSSKAMSGLNRDYTDLIVDDFDGDGKADFVIQENTAWGGDGVLYKNSVTGANDQINILSNDTKSIIFSYRALTDSTIYTKDTGPNAAVYPLQDYQGPTYVVSSVSTADGIGGNVVTSYTYGGAKADLSGRGFLGFRWTRAVSPDTGVELTTYYRQDYPYTGFPSQSEKRTTSGVLLSAVTTTYANSPITTGSAVSQFPYVSQTQELNYELDGSLVTNTTTSYQYDSYGNATQVGLAGSLLGCLLGFAAQEVLSRLAGSLFVEALPPPTWSPALGGMFAGMAAMLGVMLPHLLRLRDVPALRILPW